MLLLLFDGFLLNAVSSFLCCDEATPEITPDDTGGDAKCGLDGAEVTGIGSSTSLCFTG
jgi:hypothetical protein